MAKTEDGYRVIYALPELDPTLKDTHILLADSRDGGAQPIAVERISQGTSSPCRVEVRSCPLKAAAESFSHSDGLTLNYLSCYEKPL
ncbi:MAG: hypothetical protein GEU77_00690 [Deltaproteobacteria bacterium]|nr:hypothetical protein [Deltaproteobacteria bacterium]